MPNEPNKSKLVIPVIKYELIWLWGPKKLNWKWVFPNAHAEPNYIIWLPKILANRGKAELRITYKPQLSIICVNVVSWAIGLIHRMPGIVYNPTNEHTNRNAIRTTSMTTPTTPKDVSDEMPRVTVCCKINDYY